MEGRQVSTNRQSSDAEPLGLEIERELVQRSERVNSVDLHPTEPWILIGHYSGPIRIWNYKSQTVAMTFWVPQKAVSSTKFVAQKQWVVAGADEFIYVYNYNTMDMIRNFKAHKGYFRCVAVHPTLPYLLSASDDMLVKLWDWEKDWDCIQRFEGHSGHVMQVTFNHKDTNTFASASLDRTIKIWNLASAGPDFTLDAHRKGVNCVDYFTGGNKPYLITGSDDHTAEVWDYQTKSFVQTLEGHTQNVSAVCFHPELPIIITGSEDGTVCIQHSTTYRLENTLNCGMGRVWAIGYIKGSHRIVIGYNEGTIMVKASIDRFSQLPNHLIASVLSRLQMREAIQTSVLSRRWKDVWRHTFGTNLVFKHNLPVSKFVE